jgi:glycosyltransferase involved in cell wall biosynthesis
VAAKRNLALEAARGDVVAWFDDDDWQHPRRLSLLVEALGPDEVLAGPTRSWFVDLRRGRARPHAGGRTVIFNGSGARREAAAGVRFDERRRRAADTAWLAELQRSARRPAVRLEPVLSAWPCHDRNLSNPASRYVFPLALDAVHAAVGAEAWGETDAELAALRGRLGLD